MKPITVNQLMKMCEKQIKKGYGDNVIMISNDDEGNGYHYLWYSFITVNEMKKGFEEAGFPDETIDGLDESIALEKDTIILG